MFARCFVLLAVAAVLCSASYKDDFFGKVALVTGGSSGIGYQTALELAQYGAKVIITGRDYRPTWFNVSEAAARINADPIVKSTGGQCRAVKADMSKLEDVKALFEDIKKHENDLHFAVNSAGIGGPLGYYNTIGNYIGGEHDPARNNIYGTTFSCMYEARLMIEKNHTGAIVNLASTNGLKATPRAALYGTSKWGIVGLTHSIGALYAAATPQTPMIRVNSIAPTLTNTSLTWQQAKYFLYGQQSWDGDYITPASPEWEQVAPQWIERLVCKTLA